MKKTNKTFFTIMTLLLLPIGVNADMGIPEIQPYKAYVTNPNGINIECDNQIYSLKENEIVEIAYEYADKASVGSYKGKACYADVSINDIKPILEEYIPTEHIDEVQKLKKPRKIKIKKDGGLELYSGPSSAYKQIANIPNNMELEYTYSSGYDNGIKPVYLYVEYEGKKGWIKTGEGADGGSYLLFYFNNKLPIIEDTKLITEDHKEIIIPKNTIIEEGFMEHETFGSTMNLSNSYYVKYNNIYGRIDASEVLKYSQEITLLKSHDIYNIKDYDYKDNPEGMPTITMKGNKIGTIPVGTELSYNIAVTDYTFAIAYVEYNGQKGWVLIQEDVEYISNDDEIVEDDNHDENVEDDNNDENTTTTTTTKPIIKNEKETLSAKELIYLCIGAAVIISLTAIVTVVLVNKNNKSKNNEIINNTQE